MVIMIRPVTSHSGSNYGVAPVGWGIVVASCPWGGHIAVGPTGTRHAY